jgi:antitoxin (DNA-binding transcriptional repressor) of toxin-antitoxin stability system
MKSVFGIVEAKAKFSKLLWRVLAGEEITIAEWGVPVCSD